MSTLASRLLCIASLPKVKRQRCTVHLQCMSLAKVPHRLPNRVAREVAAVFRASGLAEAKKV